MLAPLGLGALCEILQQGKKCILPDLGVRRMHTPSQCSSFAVCVKNMSKNRKAPPSRGGVLFFAPPGPATDIATVKRSNETRWIKFNCRSNIPLFVLIKRELCAQSECSVLTQVLTQYTQHTYHNSNTAWPSTESNFVELRTWLPLNEAQSSFFVIQCFSPMN